MDGMQVVANPDTEGYEDVVRQLSTGCSVEARGAVVESPGKGQRFEFHATVVELGASLTETTPSPPR